MDSKGKVVIDDVARMAGVSKATISRYLNGKFEYMSEKTRDRIKETIEKLDYRPNNIARSLKSRKSKLIGVIIADLTNPFSSIIIKGIGDECKAKDYNMVIVNSDNDPYKEDEYIKSLLDQGVEGLIVNSSGENEQELIEVKGKGTPIVLIDRMLQHDNFNTVSSNNYDITAKTTNYLIDTGFNNLCFFTEGIKKISPRKEREQAFRDVCSQRLNEDSYNVYVVDSEQEGNIEVSICHFLNNYNGKKAIFAVNGVVLLSVLHAVNKLKLSVPKDLGVCGYDNWGWASLIPPGITTISTPSYEMGARAARMLINNIETNEHTNIVHEQVKAKLEIRGSTIL